MALTPAEELLYTTTRIITHKAGKIQSRGTGFFYNVALSRGRACDLLVTNRHVLEGCDGIHLTLPIKGEDGLPTNEFHTWRCVLQGTPIFHPDPEIDLAVLSVTELHRLLPDGRKQQPFYASINNSSMPDEDSWKNLDAIEEVIMVGCPNGLFDESNNLPIVRRGVTATHPAKNYLGREEFMVDLACFPGSSGSPVFLYSTGAIYDRVTKGYSIGQIRRYFLGVLYAGPTVNQDGKIVLTKEPRISVTAMMHLGVVIKATALLAFDEMVAEQVG